MHFKLSFLLLKPSVGLLSLCFSMAGLFSGANAWAYKVERVCEMTQPTLKKPPVKVCKTVLVKTGADGKPEKKEEKKAEKPAAGHH